MSGEQDLRAAPRASSISLEAVSDEIKTTVLGTQPIARNQSLLSDFAGILIDVQILAEACCSNLVALIMQEKPGGHHAHYGERDRYRAAFQILSIQFILEQLSIGRI